MDSMSHEVQHYPAEVVITSDPSQARLVQDEIEHVLKDHHYGDHDVFSIKLAVEEALINAIKHGNQMDRAKKVHVAYRVLPERFDVQITDEGVGFNPDDVPDPTMAENLERPCGRGVMLMRHYMTRVEYLGRGNAVSMTKLRKDGPHSNGRK
jgi:serine/threonine-protein kinase RsbW